MFSWLYRSVVLILLCLFAWQIYTHGMGRRTAELLEQEAFEGYHPLNSAFQMKADTLVALAERANESGESAIAEKTALRALAENPTSGRAASHLLSLYNSNSSIATSVNITDIADIAGNLWPAHTYTHSRLADYWAKQGRIDKLIPEWNILLIRNPQLRQQLFPNLYQIAARPEYSDLLTTYINHPPLWWEQFFSFLSHDAQIEFLRQVYQQRQQSPVPLTDEEKRTYIARLLKDKLWNEARQAWLQGLSEAQQKQVGLVYDAGFEGKSFNTGFDWQLSETKEISIKPDITYGIKGQQALHIHFRKGQPVNFQHVAQKLMLAPGQYQLSMQYRLDSFRSNKGLRWRIHCVENEETLLTETEAFTGQKNWSTLSSPFNVPQDGCAVQLLRLEADSRYRHDQVFEGHLWFDNVSITQVTDEKNH